jgi:hypothetical protein
LVHVDTTSFFLIVLSAALASVTVVVLPPRLAPPVVVFELLFGILIGPHVLGIATTDEFILFFSNLGLGMLFYFAGYRGGERSPSHARRPRSDLFGRLRPCHRRGEPAAGHAARRDAALYEAKRSGRNRVCAGR